ncbi:MAG: tRNA (adenosine(37)-N6)-threonylcarbamoyltransferase complex ATPase subunit type 1 TsaE [Candidatus Doudnabacteria bacterium]
MLTYRNLTLKETQNLAAGLADELRHRGAVIGLIGELGSGKTTFTKAFAKQLGIKKITSPTFVTTHEYNIRQGKLYHLDFYRLKKSHELLPIGFSEMRQNKNLVLVEWVDRFPQIKRQCDILISLKYREHNKRDVIIQAQN